MSDQDVRTIVERHNRGEAAPVRFWLPLSLVVIAVSAGLLFFRLGHYPFWSDEADTAIYARGIARTGDTLALIDHNILAFRKGAALKNLRGRFMPPASFYLAAPFVGTSGTGTFLPRLPFAVCGLLSVALMIFWMAKSRATALAWVVFSLGLLGNVSFFLCCRQCRYYALAILLSLVAAYMYLHWNGRRRGLIALSLVLILLLWTQYLSYAGLIAALACDYYLFARRQQRLNRSDWVLLLAPQLIAGICALAIYNPVGAGVVPDTPGRNIVLDKLILFWWNLRDLNTCEYGIGLFMLAAPLLYRFETNDWLLRAALAIVSYAAAVTVPSFQSVVDMSGADIRLMSGLIPLCIFLTALVVLTISRYRWIVALPLALLAFGTNVLHHPLEVQAWRSTPYQWLEELWTARTTSTQMAIDWIDKNVQPGQSIWVFPDYMAYPLIYHAPQAVYAWQLLSPPQGQFKDLPRIHFAGMEPPDYILAFSRRPQIDKGLALLKERLHADYKLVATLDVYWDPLTRPELFWRAFKSVEDYDRDTEAVYIFKRADIETQSP